MITSDFIRALFTEIEECREGDESACLEIADHYKGEERERLQLDVHRRYARDVWALLTPLMVDVEQLPRLAGKGAAKATKRRFDLAVEWNGGLLERVRQWGREHPASCGQMFQRVKETFEDVTVPDYWNGEVGFEAMAG